MHYSKNQVEVESGSEIQRRQSIGLKLLAVFSTVYFGFIGLCVFANTWFASLRFVGVPATVWYGVGLIGLALVIAGIYGHYCRAKS